jgi:hypothetical protein
MSASPWRLHRYVMSFVDRFHSSKRPTDFQTSIHVFVLLRVPRKTQRRAEVTTQSKTRASLIRTNIHCFQGLISVKTHAQI